MSSRTRKDWELWERVKKTARPLLRGQAVPEDFDALFSKHDNQKRVAQSRREPARKTKPAAPTGEPKFRFAPAPDLPRLDTPTARKIAKGKMPIEATIDLHGMTQTEAHRRLLAFVESSYRRGTRTVLVITGKGVGGEGILRQAVPRWVSEPEFRHFVIGHHESHRNHGGSGAIYLRIRKR